MADDANQRLLYAAFRGELRNVKKAVEDGAEIDHVGDLAHHYILYRSISALAASARGGHMLIVKYLIEAGANPYLPLNSETARYEALRNKHNDIASYLLRVMKMPKWLNKIDEASGCTPLTFFISNGINQKALDIIDLGADVCKIDRKGKTPLICATERNSLVLVEKLLAKGAVMSGCSALKCALDLKHNEIVKRLLEPKKLPLDVIFDDGSTPLTKSLNTKNKAIAKYLIENGADPAKIDRNNDNPLKQALELHYVDVAQLLITKNINDNNRNILDECLDDGFTPLTKCLNTRNEPIAKCLIENGASPAKIDRNNNNPLKQALELHCKEVAQLLITKNINDNKRIVIDDCFDDGFTPLTKSLATLNLEVARILIANAANPEKIDGNGNVPLEQTLELNSLDIANLLLEKGVKVPSTIKNNLLAKLARSGYLEVFQFLIENGWDVNQTCENGRTALAMSASNGNLFLSRVLIDNGAKMESTRDEVVAIRKSNIDVDCSIRQLVGRYEAKEEIITGIGCLEQTGQE